MTVTSSSSPLGAAIPDLQGPVRIAIDCMGGDHGPSITLPACRAFLQADYDYRRSTGELRQRVRGVYEIPGRGYGDNPSARVRTVSERNWVVTLDLSADEYHGPEQVKRALVRYPIKVARSDVDPARNPFGLVLDCYDGAPQRIAASTPESPARGDLGLQGDSP